MDTASRPRSARDILTDLGAVPFEWTLADDHVRWGSNALDVLGVTRFDSIATGTAWSALVDPATPEGRAEAIRRCVDTDSGDGIAYAIDYAILPSGPGGPQIALSETGRWYSDGRGRPARVAGLVRRIARLGQSQPGHGTDRLTGEMDRAGIIGALDMAIAATVQGKTSIALIFASVDGIEAVNETLGKQVGDEILLGAMRRLKKRLRGGDVIGRIGGNRFALILSDCNEKAAATAGARFAEGIRSKPFATDVGPLWTTLSLGGVAVPTQARTTEEALDRADDALRHARQIGPGSFHAYRRNLHASTLRLENREIVTAIQAALKDGRVELELHPIRDLATGTDIGARGACTANLDDFAQGDLAETAGRLGLGTSIDLRLLELGVAWLTEHGEDHLAIDVAMPAIASRVWAARAAKLLKPAPEIASRLTVGLSAQAIAQLPDMSRQLALDLKGLGCTLAVTDVGAPGTDPLAALDLEPVRLVAARDLIERIVRDPASSTSARALTQMGRAVGVATLAPGITDAAWLPMLSLAGFEAVEALYAVESRQVAA